MSEHKTTYLDLQKTFLKLLKGTGIKFSKKKQFLTINEYYIINFIKRK